MSGVTIDALQRVPLFADLTKQELKRIAEVFKQLVRIHAEKPLSFREKKMLDRTRTMLISEVSLARNISEPEAIGLLEKALQKCGFAFPGPA